ncbi:hypothetical protein [Candidatus Micropelagos thuwalensis]|nr:hypothetical protein [Candidatus Micropelagos thuwalensis]
MLNLLLFKNQASYAEYGKRVEAILPDYDGQILFRGAVRSVFIGENVPKF